MTRTHDIQVRRVYEAATKHDGTRVLVDRVWPRGLAKSNAALDEWCRDVAPSTELRKWFGHVPERFSEFGRHYRAELEQPEPSRALEHLRQLAAQHRLTLLTATKNPDISAATVLAEVLREKAPDARS